MVTKYRTAPNSNVPTIGGVAAPASLRLFLQALMGDKSPITEKDFTPGELTTLKMATNIAEAQHRDAISYGDYGEKDPFNPNQFETIIQGLFDPGQSMAYSLGGAGFKRNPDGTTTIKDQYDFNADQATVDRRLKEEGGYVPAILKQLNRGSLLGVGNILGNMAMPQGEGRKVQIVLPKD